MFRIWSALSHKPCRPGAFKTPCIQKRLKKMGRPKGTGMEDRLEKFAVDAKYPLTFALNEAIKPALGRSGNAPFGVPLTRGKSHSFHARTQIVSPELCDDVINYIGPMLERHKGCDILDINPGVGLWSQKLHDFLQPRSHVLLEPAYETFQRFLEPLLSAPGSKYKLVVADACEIDAYRKLMSDGTFPDQVPQGPGNQKVNDSLLVTGSLVWDPRLPGLNFDSMAKQLFHHFAAAAESNDIFHAFGLARSLLWVQQDDFGPMIAPAIAGMQKANRFLELSTNSKVIVQASRTHRKHGRASHGREPQFEIESTINALKMGQKNGMELPPHRRDHIHDFAEDLDKASNGTGITRSFAMQNYLRSQQLADKPTIGLIQESFFEHIEMEKNLRSEYPDLAWDQITLSPRKEVPKWNLKNHPGKQEITKLVRKRANIFLIIRIKEDVEATADIGEEMYSLECKILETAEGPEKDTMMKKLKDLEQQWQYGVENCAINYGAALLAETDDRLALRTGPHPRLQWDRRTFEPLTMSPSEAWPHNRLSLILSEPIPVHPSREPGWLEWTQDFIFGLYAQPHTSIVEALDKMQHGLSDIIKDCPSLRDPKKGGRLQMHHFRVRLLTVEQLEELATAYRKWPFKAPGSDHNKYFRIRGGAHERF